MAVLEDRIFAVIDDNCEIFVYWRDPTNMTFNSDSFLILFLQAISYFSITSLSSTGLAATTSACPPAVTQSYSPDIYGSYIYGLYFRQASPPPTGDICNQTGSIASTATASSAVIGEFDLPAPFDGYCAQLCYQRPSDCRSLAIDLETGEQCTLYSTSLSDIFDSDASPPSVIASDVSCLNCNASPYCPCAVANQTIDANATCGTRNITVAQAEATAAAIYDSLPIITVGLGECASLCVRDPQCVNVGFVLQQYCFIFYEPPPAEPTQGDVHLYDADCFMCDDLYAVDGYSVDEYCPFRYGM